MGLLLLALAACPEKGAGEACSSLRLPGRWVTLEVLEEATSRPSAGTVPGGGIAGTARGEREGAVLQSGGDGAVFFLVVGASVVLVLRFLLVFGACFLVASFFFFGGVTKMSPQVCRSFSSLEEVG